MKLRKQSFQKILHVNSSNRKTHQSIYTLKDFSLQSMKLKVSSSKISKWKSKVERRTQTLEDGHGPSSRAMRKGF